MKQSAKTFKSINRNSMMIYKRSINGSKEKMKEISKMYFGIQWKNFMSLTQLKKSKMISTKIISTQKKI